MRNALWLRNLGAFKNIFKEFACKGLPSCETV
jgi:hypothetical protein